MAGVAPGHWVDEGCRSPWFAQLAVDPPPRPLEADVTTDVAIIGAGIAGVSTAFFTLRDTDRRVLLVERYRAGSGATGHNAGQVANYFERPLSDLVTEYGFDMAIAAQAAIDGAFDLLEKVRAEVGSTVRYERVTGHMGMFSLNHLAVHLTNQVLRRRGGLDVEACVVADDAPFLDDISTEYSDLYSVVPRAEIEARLGTHSPDYHAVLSSPKACINSALLVEHVLEYLLTKFDDRFEYVDHTSVARIVLGDGVATLESGAHRVRCEQVVLCTNGFRDHAVVDTDGSPIELAILPTVGYMAGYFETELKPPSALSFIKNPRIGGDVPYVYVTHRTYDGPDGDVTLTCVGGPEHELDDDEAYDPHATVPAVKLEQLDREVRSVIDQPLGNSVAFDYAWHGLMGYTPSRVRLVGFEPRNHALLYNLACNGVGILPSIHGGERIARLLAGDQLPPSIFDPA